MSSVPVNDGCVTSAPLTIPALLARSCQEFGTATYIVTPTHRLTYEEAAARSAEAACWLLNAGVGKGSRVGLFFPKSNDQNLWMSLGEAA